MASTQELLIDSLRDILDAEKQAVKNYPKILKAASNAELKQCFQEHFEVTKGQVTRLEQIFEMLGERAKSKPCKAMQGLVAEAMEHLGEHERGNELDSILIAAAQKIEHYEIASYGTARAMAKSAGQKEAANLLQETLKEEGDADKTLTKVAISVYRDMAREEGESEEGIDEEEQAAGDGAGRSRGRGAASKKKVASQGNTGRAEASSRTSGGASRKSNGQAGSRPAASKNARGSQGGSKVSTDHDEIREWAEARGAHPACVRGTGGKGDTGMIRLDFPGYSGGDSLEEISWDDFFSKFDDQGLALLYQEKTARGQQSNFNKIVARETAELADRGGRGSARKGSGREAARGRR